MYTYHRLGLKRWWHNHCSRLLQLFWKRLHTIYMSIYILASGTIQAVIYRAAAPWETGRGACALPEPVTSEEKICHLHSSSTAWSKFTFGTLPCSGNLWDVYCLDLPITTKITKKSSGIISPFYGMKEQSIPFYCFFFDLNHMFCWRYSHNVNYWILLRAHLTEKTSLAYGRRPIHQWFSWNRYRHSVYNTYSNLLMQETQQ